MLKPMDPNLTRQLLEQHQDVLSAEIKAEEALYRNTQCPMCGSGECQKKIRAPKIGMDEDGLPTIVVSPFGSGPLPDGYAHCLNCGTDFNPHTGMVFRTEASMISGPE
jgi:hypothetical protein